MHKSLVGEIHCHWHSRNTQDLCCHDEQCGQIQWSVSGVQRWIISPIRACDTLPHSGHGYVGLAAGGRVGIATLSEQHAFSEPVIVVVGIHSHTL